MNRSFEAHVSMMKEKKKSAGLRHSPDYIVENMATTKFREAMTNMKVEAKSHILPNGNTKWRAHTKAVKS